MVNFLSREDRRGRCVTVCILFPGGQWSRKKREEKNASVQIVTNSYQYICIPMAYKTVCGSVLVVEKHASNEKKVAAKIEEGK